jgi:hypothetical protein
VDKFKNILWLIVFSIGTLGCICFMASIKINGQNMAAIGLGLLAVMGIVCSIILVITWADKAKEDHECRIKNGSIGYRFSQGKYIVAMVILGIFALTILYGLLHGLFVPGAGS